jgi:hypothetical protein
VCSACTFTGLLLARLFVAKTSFAKGSFSGTVGKGLRLIGVKSLTEKHDDQNDHRCEHSLGDAGTAEQQAKKNGASDGERQECLCTRLIQPPKLFIQKFLITPSRGGAPSFARATIP